MAHLAPIKIFANVPYLSLSHASGWPHDILKPVSTQYSTVAKKLV